MGVPYQDEPLSQVAVMFFSNIEPPTFGLSKLDPTRLDFSLESLLHVDEYLLAIRTDKNLEADWNRTVLRCGAYVGEVVRRLSPAGHYHWIDYQTFQSLGPRAAEYGYGAATAAILLGPGDRFVFPLAKVEKCLEFGEEDAPHFFAQCLVAEANQK